MSYANKDTYKITADGSGNSMLTGKNVYFMPVEIETFLVTK